MKKNPYVCIKYEHRRENNYKEELREGHREVKKEVT
jgi:hypothetical protein